mgnify:CR=1 FL=1
MIEKDSEFDINDYYEVPIEGSKYKSNLYVLPVFYSINFYMGNEKLLNELEANPSINWRWSDLNNIKEKIEKRNKNYYVLRKYDYDEYFWFENIIRCDIDYYIDWDGKKAYFDTKEFRDVLKLLDSIKDKFMYPEYTGRDEKGLETARNNILFFAISTGSYHWLNITNPYDEGMKLLPWP